MPRAAGAGDVLGQRALGRATLERQLLLRRRDLPAVDNLLLAHADRTRAMTDEHRRRVCVGAVVEPTVLVDGEVVAIWQIAREHGTATLEVEPLTGLSAADRGAAAQEGMRLLEFAAADADHDVRFLAPGP